MVLKPIAAEKVLANDHPQADENGVCDADKAIAGQSIAAEDKTADDRLEQVVGEAHAAIEAQVAQRAANTFESIPC